MTSAGLEEPEPDVVEQNQDAITGAISPTEPGLPDELPLEADPADVAEQAHEVPASDDDDDYR